MSEYEEQPPLGGLPQPESPPSLDAKILAHAHAHAPQKPNLWRAPWVGGLATAGVLVVAVLIAIPDSGREIMERPSGSSSDILGKTVEGAASGIAIDFPADINASANPAPETDLADISKQISRDVRVEREIGPRTPAQAHQLAMPKAKPALRPLTEGVSEARLDSAFNNSVAEKRERQYSLEEIVITAQKAEKSELSDAPLAISAGSKERPNESSDQMQSEAQFAASASIPAAPSPTPATLSSKPAKPVTLEREEINRQLLGCAALKDSENTMLRENCYTNLLKECPDCDLPKTLEEALTLLAPNEKKE